jgi:methyltransferase
LLVLLHAAWLLATALALPKPAIIHWIPLCGYIALEILRAWTMLTLGRYWTTRIISLADAPLVRRGPYRLVRHPNYIIVVGEIALLPLVFGEVWVAAIFSLLNAVLLFWRVREEESALAPRRTL